MSSAVIDYAQATAENIPQGDLPGIISYFKENLPADCVITEDEAMRPFECDGLSLYRTLAPVVLLHESVAEVITSLESCQQCSERLWPLGAGRVQFVVSLDNVER